MDLEQIIYDNDSSELLDVIKKYFNNDGEFFFQHLMDENLIPSDKVSQALFDVFPNEYIYSLIKQKQLISDYLYAFEMKLSHIN